MRLKNKNEVLPRPNALGEKTKTPLFSNTKQIFQ